MAVIIAQVIVINCYDFLHCSAKERVSKCLPLVVEAFLSIRLIEEEHHALEWLKSSLFFVLVSFSMIPLTKACTVLSTIQL